MIARYDDSHGVQRATKINKLGTLTIIYLFNICQTKKTTNQHFFQQKDARQRIDFFYNYAIFENHFLYIIHFRYNLYQSNLTLVDDPRNINEPFLREI